MGTRDLQILKADKASESGVLWGGYDAANHAFGTRS